MNEAKFDLSKKQLCKQVDKLKNLGLKISYSYKTNRIVGNLLENLFDDIDFSVHDINELDMLKDKMRIWFFTQAESEDELCKIINMNVKNFVVDNYIDLKRLLNVLEKKEVKVNLSIRMKFQEHRIGSGKYFVYGISSKKVNEIIQNISENKFIDKLGIHIHRKSQNTSEWEIKDEIEDSILEKNLKKISFINLGGGLPVQYRSYSSNLYPYIFSKIKEVVNWMDQLGKKVYIEPGRFLAGPCIKLITKVIQIYDNTAVINTTIYNCALDTHLTGTKMLIEGELAESGQGRYYLIKGNSPTRDDIFRYKVKLKNLKVGDKIVFLNAGAYNYTTDFFGYKKLKTEIID